jgi:hypothetical protein
VVRARTSCRRNERYVPLQVAGGTQSSSAARGPAGPPGSPGPPGTAGAAAFQTPAAAATLQSPQTFGPIGLSDGGETETLFSTGPFSLIGRCGRNSDSGNTEVHVFLASSQEHSSLMYEGESAPVGATSVRGRDFGPGQQLQLLGATGPTGPGGEPGWIARAFDFTAATSAGAQASGHVWVGTNILGAVHGCVFGGYVVASGSAGPSYRIAAGGDISCDPSLSSYNGGRGTATACRQLYTSDLLGTLGLSAVLPLGDNQYPCGGLSSYETAYDPTWGRFDAISHPVPGNHEYATDIGADCDPTGQAGGYFSYFGASAGDPTRGYYSFDLGSWHLIALNSECLHVGGCGAGSAQETWLRADLAAHPVSCILAYWHRPRFSSGIHGTDPAYADFWQALYEAGADIVLSGHDHDYERFRKQDAQGNYDPRGITEFVAGTGGADLTAISNPRPNSVVRRNDTFGVLELTLNADSYSWRFLNDGSSTFTDYGAGTC